MKLAAALIALSLLTLAAPRVRAEGSDEIRIGQTLPYSGPASGFGAIGRTQEAFFEKVNAEGGINGKGGDAARACLRLIETKRAFWGVPA